jgi:hypothetical protein
MDLSFWVHDMFTPIFLINRESSSLSLILCLLTSC